MSGMARGLRDICNDDEDDDDAEYKELLVVVKDRHWGI